MGFSKPTDENEPRDLTGQIKRGIKRKASDDPNEDEREVKKPIQT